MRNISFNQFLEQFHMAYPIESFCGVNGSHEHSAATLIKVTNNLLHSKHSILTPNTFLKDILKDILKVMTCKVTAEFVTNQ